MVGDPAELYSPLEPFFAKTWRPGEIEPVTRDAADRDNLHDAAKGILGPLQACCGSRRRACTRQILGRSERGRWLRPAPAATARRRTLRERLRPCSTRRQALQAAAERLLGAGFTRADLSVLGSEAALRAKFGGKVPNASELAESADTPRAALVSSGARTEGLAAIAGIPVYVGGAGAAAVAALEGATVLATAGAAVGVGLAAGALGVYVEHRMAKRHADQIDKHLKNGGTRALGAHRRRVKRDGRAQAPA